MEFRPAVDQVGGGPVGVRPGVAVDKTAAVRRERHVQQACLPLGQTAVQRLDYRHHELPAAGFIAVQQQAVPGEAWIFRVVVDGEVDLSRKALRKHLLSGHVHADGIAALAPLSDKIGDIGAVVRGKLRIREQGGALARPAQRGAERTGGTDGVPVGAGMGQDQEIVMGAQRLHAFIQRHAARPPPLLECPACQSGR